MSMFSEGAEDEILSLRQQIEELRQALSGRTVSCSACNGVKRTFDALATEYKGARTEWLTQTKELRNEIDRLKASELQQYQGNQELAGKVEHEHELFLTAHRDNMKAATMLMEQKARAEAAEAALALHREHTCPTHNPEVLGYPPDCTPACAGCLLAERTKEAKHYEAIAQKQIDEFLRLRGELAEAAHACCKVNCPEIRALLAERDALAKRLAAAERVVEAARGMVRTDRQQYPKAAAFKALDAALAAVSPMNTSPAAVSESAGNDTTAQEQEKPKPCGYCTCGHASADHFFDDPNACNFGHPCRCTGFRSEP